METLRIQSLCEMIDERRGESAGCWFLMTMNYLWSALINQNVLGLFKCQLKSLAPRLCFACSSAHRHPVSV